MTTNGLGLVTDDGALLAELEQRIQSARAAPDDSRRRRLHNRRGSTACSCGPSWTAPSCAPGTPRVRRGPEVTP
jgi:hypothetical protein